MPKIDISALHDQIASCTACVAAGFIPVANPVFRGRPDHRWMIVGQAPATLGHLRPAYAGPAGAKLRGWLRGAGIPGEDPLVEHFYLTSITKCFPGPGSGGKGDRLPSRAEIDLCAPHLAREIVLVRPDLIVTLGKLAANILVGSGSLADLVGTQRTAIHAGHSFTAIPFPHPSGVSRWLNGEPGQTRLQAALAHLAAYHVSH